MSCTASIRHRRLLWACQPAEKRVVTPVGGNTFSQLGLPCCLARLGMSWAGGHSPTRATSFLLQGAPPSLLPAVVLCTPLMHPASSSDSFSLLIWQKKDVTSCWMSLCQVNELNLSTGLSSEWEDQQQEHTAWQGRVLWGRHPILAAGNC